MENNASQYRMSWHNTIFKARFKGKNKIRIYFYLFFKKIFSNYNLLQYEFWTRSSNPNIEKSALKQLYELGFLMSQSMSFYDASNTFWNCFQKSLTINKNGDDGKQRILSIIANDFKYENLQKQLLVCINKVVDFWFSWLFC